MCREFYRAFKVRGRGTIVNVSGVAAVMKFPWYICGASGNAAIAAFTNALGGESQKDGIRVIGVSPGPVMTEVRRKCKISSCSLRPRRQSGVRKREYRPAGRVLSVAA
jgi:short-subunit dehydrogenase